MPRIELSIAADYLPLWSTQEGCRELIQNARDAMFEHQAEMSVTHHEGGTRTFPKTPTLVVETRGTILDHEMLLLGMSTKRERTDTIGRHGEGLKLGVLALIRAGHKVKIRTGGEQWTPSIIKSTKFRANVLVFDVKLGYSYENRVRIEVDGLSAETWADMQPRFRFLGTEPGPAIDTSEGTLLFDDSRRGLLFVKGIYVAHDPKLIYGYDFPDADMDRDRKMIHAWDLGYRCARIWKEAAASRPDLVIRMVSLAESGAKDVTSIEHPFVVVPEAVSEAARTQFVERFGENSVPVKSLSDSAEVERLGRKGIVVSPQLGRLLGPMLPTIESLREALKEEITHRYGWHDLIDVEKANLLWAAGLLQQACSQPDASLQVATDDPLAPIEVVDFRTADTIGLHKDDGKVYVARLVLCDAEETLATLIHEKAHECGGDGSPTHVARMEEIWTKVVRVLRSGNHDYCTESGVLS